MSKPRVLATRKIPDAGLRRIAETCELQLWKESSPIPRAVLLSKVANVQGLVTLLSDGIDEAVLQAAPELRVISQYAVGYDNIDVAAATARGIPVGNTPGVLTDATADLAFALLLAAARRLVEGVDNVRDGGWQTWGPKILLGQSVWGATLGIVGLGRIGTAMARRGRGFDMRVLYTGPHRKPDLEAELGVEFRPLAELLAAADFVSLHCPLTAETTGLIDAAALRRMKPTAVLINTARGGVVETDALVAALQEKVIAAAGLDVTAPEPLPADHPLVDLPNCIVTPHIGSATVSTRTRMAEMAADNLLAGLRGDPLPHCVNPEVYR